MQRLYLPVVIIVLISVLTIIHTKEVNVGYGCTKDGYCWSYCAGAAWFAHGLPLLVRALEEPATKFAGEWCYTSPGKSQSYQYQKCKHFAQCDPNWSCAGPCTL